MGKASYHVAHRAPVATLGSGGLGSPWHGRAHSIKVDWAVLIFSAKRDFSFYVKSQFIKIIIKSLKFAAAHTNKYVTKYESRLKSENMLEAPECGPHHSA